MKFKHLTLLVGMIISSASLAEKPKKYDEIFRPYNTEDAKDLQLSIAAKYLSKYNPTLSESVDEQQGYGMQLQAQGRLINHNEGADFQLIYDASVVRTEPSSDALNAETFADLSVEVATRLHLRNNLIWEVNLRGEHEDERFGRGLSQRRSDDTRDIDTRNEATLASTLVLGHDKRSVRIMGLYDNVSYDTTNLVDNIYDREEFSLVAQGNVAISDKTSLIAQLKLQDNDYTNETRVDSQMWQLLTGVRWQASGKSALRALLGGYSRDLDDGETVKGVAWLAEYIYTPGDTTSWWARTTRSSSASQLVTSDVSVNTGFEFGLEYVINDDWLADLELAASQGKFYNAQTTQTLNSVEARLGLIFFQQAHSRIRTQVDFIDAERLGGAESINDVEVTVQWQVDF